MVHNKNKKVWCRKMEKNVFLELIKDNKWKNKDEKYLFELQKLLDLIDNVEKVELQKEIINQVLKFDKCVTDLAENYFEKLTDDSTKS